MQDLSFEAIGTKWQIESKKPLSESVRQALTKRIETFDRTYSRFREDSLVSQVTRKSGEYEFPADIARLFGFYRLLYEITDGAVTPLIGGILEAAGYDAKYSLQPTPNLPGVPTWEAAMQLMGNTLTTHMPLTLDVGAAGKGYLVDIIAELLIDHGVTEFIIDASGDILHKTSKADKIGLEHPFDLAKVIGVATLQNKSLAASANNRRAWGDMHHIFDPHKRKPVESVIATWVVADTTMVADGVATALFFNAPERLRRVFDFEYVRILSDGTIDQSGGFQGELFT